MPYTFTQKCLNPKPKMVFLCFFYVFEVYLYFSFKEKLNIMKEIQRTNSLYFKYSEILLRKYMKNKTTI